MEVALVLLVFIVPAVIGLINERNFDPDLAAFRHGAIFAVYPEEPLEDILLKINNIKTLDELDALVL